MAKAKRKLNTTFLALAALMLFCLVIVVGAVAYLRLRRGNPAKWEAAGKQQMALGKYDVAFDDLLRALSKRQNDPELLKLVGDTCEMRTQDDPENFRKATQYYDMALTVDPTYLPALRAELAQYQDALDHAMRLTDRTEWAKRIQKTAKNLLAVDPTDRPAVKAAALMPLELYLDGTPTDPKLLEAAVDQCKTLAKNNPADSDLPFFMARTRFVQASDAMNNREAQEANRRLSQATQIMDEAVKGQEQNAAMVYRSALVHFEGAAGTAARDQRVALLRTELAQLKHAQELVKPDDPMYIEINLTYALQLRHSPDLTMLDRLKQGEALYRDMLAHQPGSLPVRLTLADMLGRLSRRPEAIAIVSAVPPATQPKTGMDGALVHEQEDMRLVVLAKLQIELADTLPRGANRDKLLADVSDNIQKLLSTSENAGLQDNPEVLFIKGQLQLLQQQPVDGIQTLNHALQLNESNDGNLADRLDIMYHLATAYYAAGQNGEAQSLAEGMVKIQPQSFYGQRLLAELLIRKHDIAGAEPHIKMLEAMPGAADEPVVIALRLSTYDVDKDQDKIHATLAKLPETTPAQCMAKAQTAAGCKAYDVTERLLLPFAGPDKPDLQALNALAHAYVADNKKAQAVAMIDAALAKDPKSPPLTMLKTQYSNASAQDVYQSKITLVNNLTDPLQREVSLAVLAREDNDMKGWVQHLQAAEKLKKDRDGADDPRIVLNLFQAFLSVHDWDDANKYREILAKLDPNGAALSTEARYDLARGQIAQAEDAALKLSRERPEFAGSWVILGMVKQTQGHFDEAVTNYSQALDRQVDNAEAFRGIVDCYYQLNQPDQAKKYIDQAQRVLPNEPLFKELGITWETRFGDPEKAIQPRIDELTAAPDEERNWYNLARTYMAVANAKHLAKDDTAAQGFYRNAADKLAEGLPKWPDDGAYVALLAAAQSRSGDFGGAEKAVLTWAGRDLQKGKADTALTVAEFYVATNHYPQAETTLRDYLKTPHTDGSDIAVAVQLSHLLAVQNRFDEALGALPANSIDPGVVDQKVRLYLSMGKPQDADQALNASTNGGTVLTPEQGDLKVQILFAENRLLDAKTVLDKIIAADPDDVDALVKRGSLTMDLAGGDPTQALADLSHARDVAPTNIEVRLKLAEIDRRRNHPEDAAKELEAAMAMAPDNKVVRLRLLDVYITSEPPRWIEAEDALTSMRSRPALAHDPEIDNAEAIMDLDRGRYDRALDAAKRAVAGGFGNQLIDRVYVDALLHNGLYPDVITETDKIIPKDHDLWWIHRFRGQAQIRANKDHVAALAEFNKALALAGPDNGAIRDTMESIRTDLGLDEALALAEQRAISDDRYCIIAATYRQQKGDYPGAIKWVDRALADYNKLTPEQRAIALRTAGDLYLAERPQEIQKAVDVYRQLLQLTPDDLVALNNLACILADPGPASNPQDAKQYSTRAYDLMTQRGIYDPSIMDTQGWVLICNGEVPDGINMIRDALNRSKADFPDAHYHLGTALLKQNAAESAVRELNQAQQLIDQAEKENRPVDDVLKGRVQDALHRAKALSAG